MFRLEVYPFIENKTFQQDVEHDFQRRAALLWGAFVLPEPLRLASLVSSPSRGASGETGNSARIAKASTIRGGGNASALTEGFGHSKLPFARVHFLF